MAHKGMLFAAKAMALAAMRLMEDSKLLEQAKQEYREEMEGQAYIPIPDEVKPRAISQIR